MLEDLPDDIIIIILKKIDIKSLTNLYKISVRMQNIIIQYNVIKECNISLSTMGTTSTLQSKFFKDIAHNLSKLNLSGVFDLRKSSLIPIMTKLKNLKALDVSYTPISLEDFVDIFKVCPTINNITIHFKFDKKCSYKVPQTTLLECQNVFKEMECVHFVGHDNNLLCSNISMFILSLAKLKKLQYTVVVEELAIYDHRDFMDTIQMYSDYFCLWKETEYDVCYIEDFAPLRSLDLEYYEYFVLHFHKRPNIIFATEIFSKFFLERFDLKCDNSSNDLFHDGNVCIMLWKKQINEFSNRFFDLLYEKIKTYFIYHCEDKWNPSTILKYNRFCIKPRQIENTGSESVIQLSSKVKEIVPPNFILSYDKEFKNKQEFDLYIMFSYHINAAVILPSNCEYLQKITYLNLNYLDKFNSDFFDILFRSCTNLITLNVVLTNMSMSMVTRSVSLSQTIKNLRIVGIATDFDSLIMSLGQCASLENIYIGDHSNNEPKIFDPTHMIEKSSNLYCVCIYRHGITIPKIFEQLKLTKTVRKKCNKMYIYFQIKESEIELEYNVPNPYISVFRLYEPRH